MSRSERFLAITFEVLAVTALSAMAVFHHVYWAWRAPVVGFGDTATHLHLSASMYQLLHASIPAWQKMLAAWAWRGMYPPLVYLTTAGWAGVEGPGLESAIASLAPYIVILLLGAYLLGRRVGGPIAGALAACLVIVEPVLLTTQLAYFIDIPVAAFCLLALAFLAMSEGFTRPAASLAVGVAVGLGFLAKFSILFFLVVPLGWVALQTLRAQAREDSEAVVRFVVLLLVPTVLYGLLVAPMVRQARLSAQPLLVPAEMAFGIPAWVVVCLVCWALSGRLLRGPCRSVYRAACAFALLAGPWILSNAVTLLTRSGEMRQHGFAEIQADLADLGSHLPSYLLFAFQLALVAFLLSGRVRRGLTPAYLALIGGGVITFIMQPSYSLHYMVPLTALAAVIAGASVPRWAGVSLPLALAGLALATLIMLQGPARALYPREVTDLTPWLEEAKTPVLGPRDPARPFDEDFGRDLVRRLPPGVLALAFVDGWNTFPNQALYSLATGAAWNGRILQVWMAAVDPAHPLAGGGNPIMPDLWTAARLQALGRLQGIPEQRLRPPSADAVVVCRMKLTLAQMRSLFAGEYREMSSGTPLAKVYLRSPDARSPKPSATPARKPPGH